MAVAIIGPICRDIEIIGDKRTTKQIGGVTYYTGQALASLGVKTTVFGSFNSGDPFLKEEFKFDLFPIESRGTMIFENLYPNPQNLDIRVQKAFTPYNRITFNQIPSSRVSGLEYLVFGPLYNQDISATTIKDFSKYTQKFKTKIVLAPQGMIRYNEGDNLIWKNPKNVLNALSSVNYLFLDEGELDFISGISGIENGAHYLQNEFGAKNVIVTQGSYGSKLFLGDKYYAVRTFPPKELVSTTGAGDSYMAGYLKSQELFEDPNERGEFAAMTATMAIEGMGPFNGTVEDVMERLEARKNL